MFDFREYVRQNLRLRGVQAQREAEIVEDLAQQLDDAYGEALARGLTETESVAAAQRHISDWAVLARQLAASRRVRLSGPNQWQLAADDAAGRRAWWSPLAGLGRDLLFSARMLRKNAGFTFVAVITLALGIGANSAIFSAVYRVLLQPLPFYQPERLVSFREIVHGDEWNISLPNFMDWRARNHVFEDMAIYRLFGSAMVRTSGGPVMMRTANAEPRLFPLLGAHFILGRPFTEAERQAGRLDLVVLSYRAWDRYFGRDPNIVGKQVVAEGEAGTVVGVLGEFPIGDQDLWLPLETSFNPNVNDRGNHPGLAAVARLRPGVSLEQAQREMSSIAQSLAREYPATNTDVGVRVWSLQERLVGNVRLILLVLFAAVGFVLLIACSNVANMLLARAAVRNREAAVRSALGAGRGRLVSLFLAEASLLAVLGGAAGLALATWMVAGLRAMAAQLLPTMSDITLQPAVFAFAAAVTLGSGLLFGLAPALSLARAEPAEALTHAGRSGMMSRAHQSLRKALIAAEVAFSVILLCGAGLMIRSFARMMTDDLGYRTDHAFTLSLRPDYTQKRSPERSERYARSVLERLQTFPGVISGAAAWPGPANGVWLPNINFEEHPVPDGKEPMVTALAVTPQYFSTLGIPFQVGRGFTDQDRAGAPLVAVVNEEFAHRFFPNENALGKHFKAMGVVTIGGWAEIVGVVGNTRGFSLTGKVTPEIYWPFYQFAQWDPGLVIRVESEPAAAATAVRKQVEAVDPTYTVYGFKALDELVAQPAARQRFTRLLLTCLAGLALALAAIGIYGLLSYSVAQRRQEIGVRVALGASGRRVQALIVRQTFAPIAAGLVLGLAGAAALTRFLRGLLFGITPFDVPTFVSVAAMLVVVGLLAAWAPAHTAASVDPLEALRTE
ncbi:MAG TPA: ABC transporter permease [Terriglobales bacterium]|nr:ABC transporter permease [Terriglobales bacterium]